MMFSTSRDIILASASPRRKELFSLLNVPFSIETANVKEQSIHFENEVQYVRDVALLKARAVAALHPGNVVIGADTTVAYDGKLLHKPVTEEEAEAHLQMLSGKTHEVYTAVIIIDENQSETYFIEKTEVTFKKLNSKLIKAYVNTKDPFDKAGGYGIQTAGALFVEKINGDYYNVMGLPIATLAERLQKLNIITL